MTLWEVIGWTGSALLILSLLQTDVRRLRVLNLAGCAAALAFNLALGVGPSVALNAALISVNLLQLMRMKPANKAPAPDSRRARRYSSTASRSDQHSVIGTRDVPILEGNGTAPRVGDI